MVYRLLFRCKLRTGVTNTTGVTIKMKRTATDWIVTGLGAAVTTAGAITMRNRSKALLGSGILGFGLAHVVLGVIDRVWSD